MYEVVLAVAPADEHRDAKAEAVLGLPGAAGTVRATVVHVADPGTDVTAIPSVAAVLERFEDAGVACRARRGEGRPTRALLDAATAVDADRIVVAGRRRSPAGKLQLHPGARQVALNADCPVVVTGASAESGATHV
jgi:nucleotide-binding universal stress UspA family protein